MKKLFIAMMILSCAFVMQAADAPAAAQPPAKAVPAQPQAQPLDKWTPFQICFWFDIPASSKTSNVFGIKTGQTISSGIGRVYGLEASWFCAATDNVEGAQGSWFVCINKKLEGVQASLAFCRSKEELTGLQASLINIGGAINGFQPGGVNIDSGDVNGIQMAAITNVSKDLVGAQFGIVNYSKKLTGFQASALNMADGGDGFQLGAINISNTRGIQFGAINYIKDGWIPFLPILNISWK